MSQFLSSKLTSEYSSKPVNSSLHSLSLTIAFAAFLHEIRMQMKLCTKNLAPLDGCAWTLENYGFTEEENVEDCYSIMLLIFSSPEPLGSQGELIVYALSRRPSSVRPSVVHNAQTSSPQKLLGRSKPNFCGASLGRGNESLYKWSRSRDQDGRHAHIW